jgi:hypothetical protein
MQFVLSLPMSAMIALATVYVALCISSGLLILKLAPRMCDRLQVHVPQPNFMSVVATAWALSLGFAASDLWNVGGRADEAIATERSALHRIISAASDDGFNHRKLYERAHDYAQLVEKDEWTIRQGRFGAPSVDEAIRGMRLTIMEGFLSDVESPVGVKLMNDLDKLLDARTARLGIAITSIDASKWYMLLALTFLTSITIALAHLNQPLAGRNALIIFGLTSVAGLWVLVAHTDPFADVGRDYLSYRISQPPAQTLAAPPG